MAMIALKCPHIEVSYISLLFYARARERARAFILPTKKILSVSTRAPKRREYGDEREVPRRLFTDDSFTLSLLLSLSRARFVRDLFSIGRRAVFFYLSFNNSARSIGKM